MSNSKSSKIKFKCWSDCTQLGCPGHTMECNYSNTADVACFFVDGSPVFYTDPYKWSAMIKVSEEVNL